MKDIMKFQTHPQHIPTHPHTHTVSQRTKHTHRERDIQRGSERGRGDMRLLVWQSGRKTALFWTKEKILHT